MATKQALIITTTASAADSSSFPSVTGLEIKATEPTGTATRYLVKTGSTWQRYNTGSAAWEDAKTQNITPASVMSEGNTKTELNGLASTAFTGFTGKKVDVAAALEATNENLPSITSVKVKGESGAKALSETVNHDTVTLSATEAVDILDINVDTATTGGGKVDVQASIQKSDDSWSDYQSYSAYVTSPATKAKAIKFRSILTVKNVGTDTAAIKGIEVRHRNDSVTVFSEGTGVCITKTHNFVNDIRRAHLIVKHPAVADTEFTAEVSLRPATHTVEGEVLGTGDGTAHTYTLKNKDGLASHGFTLYFDDQKQKAGTYSFSPNDGHVTCTAPEGVSVTADYIYGWTAEAFQQMTHDQVYPDKNDSNLLFDQFDYVYTKEGDQKGSVGCARVNIIQHTGTVKSEALDTSTGALQSFKLAHHAKAETVKVFADGAELPKTAWKYKDNTDMLKVTADKGKALTVSYDWAARPVYIEDLTIFFNE